MTGRGTAGASKEEYKEEEEDKISLIPEQRRCRQAQVKHVLKKMFMRENDTGWWTIKEDLRRKLIS